MMGRAQPVQRPGSKKPSSSQRLGIALRWRGSEEANQACRHPRKEKEPKEWLERQIGIRL